VLAAFCGDGEAFGDLLAATRGLALLVDRFDLRELLRAGVGDGTATG
jgi:hypothetical protein